MSASNDEQQPRSGTGGDAGAAAPAPAAAPFTLSNPFAGPAPAAAAPVSVPSASSAACALAAEQDEVLQYKVVVLGEAGVGKTALIARFLSGAGAEVAAFSQQYTPSAGADVSKRRVALPGGVHASLQLWDVPGSALRSPLLPSYLFAAQAVVLVYDVTAANTFVALPAWLAAVRAAVPGTPVLAVVGNKMDDAHARAVRPEQHAAWADAQGALAMLLSARLGDLVEVLFRRVAADLAGVALVPASAAGGAGAGAGAGTGANKFATPGVGAPTGVETAPVIVPARIANHQQHDPAQAPLVVRKGQGSSACAVM